MEEFARWLGRENGKEMVRNILASYECTKEQARAAVTTYCVLFDVEVDTRDWDDMMRDIYDHYNSWFNDYDELDMFMCEDLV